MFLKEKDEGKHLFRYSELVFPRKIIINFFLSSALAISLFFTVAFLIHKWAITENEKAFMEQQSLQVLLAKQAMEDNIHEIFFNLDVACMDFRSDLLDEDNDSGRIRVPRFIQTGKNELLGFLVSKIPGEIDFAYSIPGENGDVAKSIGGIWLKEYWSNDSPGENDFYSRRLYVSRFQQLLGAIVPLIIKGEVKGLVCAVIDLKPIISKFIFPISFRKYGIAMLLSGDGTILFEEKANTIGGNIFSNKMVTPGTAQEFNESVFNRILGSRTFQFASKDGDSSNRWLVSWHAMYIEEQTLILLLTATENDVNAALHNFQTQIIILGVALAITVISINFLLITSRKKIVQQNIRNFEILVDERTRELALSETRYQAVFQAADDAILILKDHKIVNFNNKALKMFGYIKDEFKELTYYNLSVDEIDGKSAYSAIENMEEEALSGVSQFFEWTQLKKDKTTFFSEVSLSVLNLEDEHFLLAIVRDVTERKKAQTELYKLNAELEKRVFLRTAELEDSNIALKDSIQTLHETRKNLVEAEKMASLATLVAGVAHEINTPVGMSITAASYLEQQTVDFFKKYETGEMKRSDLENYLDVASESSKVLLDNLEIASEHIKSFKQVAVDQASQEMRIFNLKEYIEESLISLQPVLKKTKHIINVTGDDNLVIESMPGALSQIITNFVMNSLNHAFLDIESGKMDINVEKDENDIILRFADDGIGMDAETKEKIFEPFFTTKRGAGGSGLGMHIVYNIVTQSLKGAIHCESFPGKGTIFIIRWPVGTKIA